jgi:hypothetical protein
MKFHIQNQSALPNSFPIFFPAPLVVTALVAKPVIFIQLQIIRNYSKTLIGTPIGTPIRTPI